MNDWLVKLAEQQPTDEEQLMAAMEGMSVEDLQEIASYEEPQTENLDSFEEKVAAADQMGREMAHRYGDELEKVAILPLLALAGKAVAGLAGRAVASKALGSVAGNVAGAALGGGGGGGGGVPAPGGFKYASEKQAFIGALLGRAGGAAAKGAASAAAKKPSVLGGLAKSVGTDMAIGKGIEMVTGGGRQAAPAAQAAPMMAQQAPGFSYGTGKFASVRDLYVDAIEKQAKAGGAAAAGIGQKLLGMAVKNPNLAIGAAGAIGGALTAPRDPMTGEKQWASGALKSGLLAGGAAKLTGAGNWARKQVTTGAWGDGIKDNAVAGMRALKADKAQAAAGKVLPKATATAAPTVAQAPAPAPAPAPAQAPAPSAMQQVLHADPSQVGVTPHGAQQVASEVAGSERGPLSKMKNMLMGRRGINVPAELEDPGKVVIGSAKFAMLTPVERIKLAMMLSKHATPGAAMFSTKISPAAAGQAVKSGFGGATSAARQAVKPPPLPAAALNRMHAGSPFAAAPKPGGLSQVQQQLNSARSVAGGGVPMPSGGGASITAMPGSGW